MNLKDCKWRDCLSNKHEMLGMLFLIVATILTIIAWDSFGIVAMFVVGLVLIGHKHFRYFGCNCCCHSSHDECCDKEKCDDDKSGHHTEKESKK